MRSCSLMIPASLVIGGWLSSACSSAQPNRGEALANVNGTPITSAQLELEYLSRQIPEDMREQHRDHILHELVDRTLMAGFLAKRKVEVPERELENQLATLRRIVTATDGDFEAAIAGLGFTEESLREHLSLPLAWQIYIRKTVTDEQLRQEFQQHQSRYDGTRVRASQIVITVPMDAPEAEWDESEAKLQSIRGDIEGGKLTFADAARQFSTSPSGQNGGDLGYFEFRGRLPVGVSSQAFESEVGELSPVFRSPFGVHLLTVTDRRPGDLSLEDVRDSVLEQLSRTLWQEQVKVERQKARIQWLVDPPPDGKE